LSEIARELFRALQARIKEVDPDATEMVEAKSVSYQGPMFFREILPRKNKLSLLLPLEFNELPTLLALPRTPRNGNSCFMPNTQEECCSTFKQFKTSMRHCR
jgi:predicted transport protein